jgi:hypothetical protein
VYLLWWICSGEIVGVGGMVGFSTILWEGPCEVVRLEVRVLARTLLLYMYVRQKYWEIRTNFTTLLLHNYNVKLDCEDYSKNLPASVTCLALLWFLEVLKLQSAGSLQLRIFLTCKSPPRSFTTGWAFRDSAGASS